MWSSFALAVKSAVYHGGYQLSLCTPDPIRCTVKVLIVSCTRSVPLDLGLALSVSQGRIKHKPTDGTDGADVREICDK